MYEYEVKAADGRVFRMRDSDPERACQRVADLHQVTVVAWRYPRVTLQTGVGRGIRIIG